jgi:ethanolamine permease
VTIVRGSIACVLTLFLTSMFTLWVSSTLPHDDIILAESLSPLSFGLEKILSITSEMALILSIPATFATGFGFIYGYGRVILSMARSDLLPSILSRTYGKSETPCMAILAGSFLSYILVILVCFLPEIEVYLFNVTILAAFTAYNSQFIGFLSLRYRFPAQERLFTSPLGIYGALYGMTVFTLGSISVIGFQNDGSTAFIIFIMIIVICSIYYFAYAKKRQGFSEEEKFIFVLQIVKCKFFLCRIYENQILLIY